MSNGTVAAVDLGATSGRVIVGRVGPDTLETVQVARFPNNPMSTPDGLHWDVRGLNNAVLDGLRSAFHTEPTIASIGVDGWAVDYGLLRNGRLLAPPFHYRDDRTSHGVQIVHEQFPHEDLFARNGLQFLPFNTLYQLAAEGPEALTAADTLLLIPDLIGYWLTGQARTERTNASTTGLLRVADGTWDDQLITDLGIPADLFAPLITAGERLGGILPAVATRIGAGPKAVVTAVGSHDTASAVVAVPMQPDAAVYISCGTWGLVGVEVNRPILTSDSLESNFTNEAGVDGRTRLLHNVMGLWILTETLRGWKSEGHSADLSELLSTAAGIDRRTVPLFDVNDPRFLPPGDMPARIDTWCAEQNIPAPRTHGEYVRSIIESLAQAFADTAHRAADISGIDARTIHIVGGGAMNGPLCQSTADRAGLPVLAGPIEATAIGNVLIQARSLGLVSGDLEALRALVLRTSNVTRYEPRTSW